MEQIKLHKLYVCMFVCVFWREKWGDVGVYLHIIVVSIAKVKKGVYNLKVGISKGV